MSTTQHNRLRRAGAIAGAAALTMGLFGFAAPAATTAAANPVTDFSSNLSSQFFPGGPGDDEECAADANSPEITGNIHQVPAPPAGAEWIYTGDSNYDDCSALTYATLEVDGGTVSSPT